MRKKKSDFLPYCKSWFKVDEFKDGWFYSFFYKTINLDGIPYMLNVWKNKIEFHPVTVCQYALHYYNTKRFDDFMRLTDFLVYKQKNGWLYHNFKPKMWGYKFRTPWVSGMVQGMFLSILVRAANLTKDLDYIFVADEVLKTLKSPKICKKGWIYEFGTRNPKVLNGHLYALIGIKEYTGKIPEVNYEKFMNHEGELWTKYDNKYLVASLHYYQRHRDLFKEVYNENFSTWAGDEAKPDMFIYPRLFYQRVRSWFS